MNEILVAGLNTHLQDVVSKSTSLLIDAGNLMLVQDEDVKNLFLTNLLNCRFIDNGIRLAPINVFFNATSDYYLCQLKVDCSGFHTLREGYRNRGVFLEFCGLKLIDETRETLSIIPKSYSMGKIARRLLSFFGLSRYILTNNHLVDSRYEIESSSKEFGRSIINDSVTKSLSRSNSISLSIKNGLAFCGTGNNPKADEIMLLKSIFDTLS